MELVGVPTYQVCCLTPSNSVGRAPGSCLGGEKIEKADLKVRLGRLDFVKSAKSWKIRFLVRRVRVELES